MELLALVIGVPAAIILTATGQILLGGMVFLASSWAYGRLMDWARRPSGYQPTYSGKPLNPPIGGSAAMQPKPKSEHEWRYGLYNVAQCKRCKAVKFPGGLFEPPTIWGEEECKN